jgi:TP901-1 family phage major tail protein
VTAPAITDGFAATTAYRIIAGLRSKTLTLNNEEIDVTNHDSNEWKTLIQNAGIKSLAISGSGIFKSDDDLRIVQYMLMEGTIFPWRIYDEDASLIYEAYFKITSFERAGDYNNEQSYTLSLSSSGQVHYAAA